MNHHEQLIYKFTSKGQDCGVQEPQGHELEEYKLILGDLEAKHINSSGKVPRGSDIQVINEIVTSKNENVTPKGLVNVSLEYLARILTFAKRQGIQWQVESRSCSDTHYKNLSRFKITVDCNKASFMSMAQGTGFRY